MDMDTVMEHSQVRHLAIAIGVIHPIGLVEIINNQLTPIHPFDSITQDLAMDMVIISLSIKSWSLVISITRPPRGELRPPER